MENSVENSTVSSQPKSSRPRGIKTADIRRMKRQGYSTAAICNQLGVSAATVSYHLMKRRKPKDTTVVKTSISTAEANSFEAELFGTLVKLDRRPASIECIGNRLIIK